MQSSKRVTVGEPVRKIANFRVRGDVRGPGGASCRGPVLWAAMDGATVNLPEHGALRQTPATSHNAGSPSLWLSVTRPVKPSGESQVLARARRVVDARQTPPTRQR